MFLIFLPVEDLLKLYVKIFKEAACFFCVFFLYHFIEDELKASHESLLEESIFGLVSIFRFPYFFKSYILVRDQNYLNIT